MPCCAPRPGARFLAALLAPAAFLLYGCGFSETPVERGNEAQILHLGNSAEPDNLDPHTVTGLPEARIISTLLEGLVAVDPSDNSVVPAAAESWEVSDDHLTYTFYLREDGTWSNGDPVTAADFHYSFRRILSPRLGSRYAEMLYPVVNAKAYHRGELDDFAETGFRVLDEHTLEIELEHPVPYFLSLHSHIAWFPVHPPTIEEFGGIDRPATPWTRQEHFVGNGPFTLEEWRTHRRIRVDRNPHYWDADTVRLERIVFHPMDTRSQERAFRGGQLHATDSLPSDRLPRYRNGQSDILRSHPYYGTYYYRFNTTREPLDQKEVRRALSLAIDRESIVEDVLQGGRKPAYAFAPPGIEDYPYVPHIEGGPEEARELLAEAGFPDGDGFPRLTLLYNTSEEHQTIAQAVQQMWREELNIDVSLQNQEWQVFLDTQNRLEYDISRSTWIGDYLDPHTFLDLMVTDRGNNRTGWGHPEYDELMERAARTADTEERRGLFEEAESLLAEHSPVAPVYFYHQHYLLQPSVRNWTPNTLGLRPYKQVYLEND